MAKYKVYEIFIDGSIIDNSYDTLEDAEKRFNSSLELFYECMYNQYESEYDDVWQTIKRGRLHADTVKAVLTKVENNKETVLKVEGLEINYVKKNKNIDSEEEKNRLKKLLPYEWEVKIL